MRVFFLFLVLWGFQAQAEHATESLRAEAEAPLDCGSKVGKFRLGEAQIQFSPLENELKIDYGPESAVTLSYGPLPWVRTLTPKLGIVSGCGSAESLALCKAAVGKAKEILADAQKVSEVQAEGVACANEKINLFEAALKNQKPEVVEETLPPLEEVKDCGSKIGQITLQHGGRGLFSYNSYDLKISFGPGPNEMVLDYNLGFDSKVYVSSGPNPSYSFKGDASKSRRCSDDLFGCDKAAKKIKKMLATAKARLGALSSLQREAMACANQKLGSFVESIEPYLEAYYRPPQVDRSERRKSDNDDGQGVRLKWGNDGPELGLQTGPFYTPFHSGESRFSPW